MAGDVAVTAEWVREQMKRGEPLFLVELRHAGDVDLAVMKARGALRLTDEEAPQSLHLIPKERAVLIYSTAPRDDPALLLARLLEAQGGDPHVLAGGFKSYLNAGLPIEEIGEGRNMRRLRGY